MKIQIHRRFRFTYYQTKDAFLKQISQKQIVDDKFLSLTTAEDLLEDIIKSFNETTDKII